MLFQLFQRAHVAEHPLLGVLAHGAGVEQNQVGLLDAVADAEAHVLQNALELFAVVDVLLAAVAVHVGHGRGVVVFGQRFCRGRVVYIGRFFQVMRPPGVKFWRCGRRRTR